MPIFKNDPPNVAEAKITAWSRAKELWFLACVERLIVKGNNKGLHRERMAKVLLVASKKLSGSRCEAEIGADT